MSQPVIAFRNVKGKIVAEYYKSVEDVCLEFGIKHHAQVIRLIESGQLAPDGKTTFDYPTEEDKC